MGNKNNIIDISRFKKSYDNALKKTAQKIGREIEYAYEAQISRFYNDYTPIEYDRTYSTWWGSSGLYNYKSWSEYLGDLQYKAGITVGAENLQNKCGDPYRADTEWVFDRTWRLGIHGINRNNIRHKMVTKGRGKKKRTYEVRWAYRQFPTNTRPSPQEEFVKAFNKIKQHRHLDEVFSSYWVKELSKLK